MKIYPVIRITTLHPYRGRYCIEVSYVNIDVDKLSQEQCCKLGEIVKNELIKYYIKFKCSDFDLIGKDILVSKQIEV